jgi:hypothetical protein
VNDRHLLFRPSEWAGLPLVGWWAVSDGDDFIALFKETATISSRCLKNSPMRRRFCEGKRSSAAGETAISTESSNECWRCCSSFRSCGAP